MRTHDRPEEPPLEIIFEEAPPRRGRRWVGVGLAALLLGGAIYAVNRPPERPPLASASLPDPIEPAQRPLELAIEPPVRPRLNPIPVTFTQDKTEETQEVKPAAVEPEVSEVDRWLEEAEKLSEKEPARAAELYSKVLALEPKRVELWPTVAALWIRAKNPDAAAVAYRSHLLKCPDDSRSLNNLALLEIRAGHFDSAKELLQRALQAGATAPIWFNIGNLHARRDELEKAQAAYANARGLDPNHVGVRYNSALVLERLGRVEDAAAALLDSDSADPEIRAHRGRLMALAGGGKADRILEEARKVEDAQIVRAIAEGFEGAGKLEHALAVLDRAVELAPTDARILHNRGAIRQAIGDLDRAGEDYGAALKADERQVETHFNLATVQEARGSYVKALESYQSVLRRQPGHEAALNNVGVLYLRINEPKKAVSLFEKAIQADPKSARAHLNLGWAYLALERHAEALVELKAHAGLATPSPEVRRAIEALEGRSK